MTPSLPSTQQDDEIDLGRLLATLWKGKLWIGLGAALGLAAGAYQFANTTKVFQADALLQLEEKTAALALPSSLTGMVDNDPRSATEIEILRSRLVLGQAVADLNLDWRVSPELAPVIGTMLTNYRLGILDPAIPDQYARLGDGLTLSELIVPPSWVNRVLSLEVAGDGRFELTLPPGDRLQGSVGLPLAVPEAGFRMTVSEITAPAGRRFAIRQIDENSAIGALRGRVSITERGRASGILEVRVTGPGRHDNPRALNAILAAYQRQNVARSAAQAEGSLTFIREQLPHAERNLREAETALNSFRQQQVSVDLSMETQTILMQITRVETELAELQRREDELALRFTPAHPTYRLLLDERARLEGRLADLRSQIGELPETQRQIVNLTRDLELAQRLHLELLTRAQEVEVMRASTIGNVRVVDAAVPGPFPIAPRSSQYLAIGLLLGLIAGVAVVFLRNWLRKGVQDAADLEHLGLPNLATINYNRLADSQGRRKGSLPILAIDQPNDLTVEAFRSLRTSLHFGMLDAQTPTLTITSTHPGAGKSFVATNLAVVIAQAGHRVCLVDGDLRRGQLRRYFGLPRHQPGLAEVLAGDRRIDEVLVPGPLDGLHVLPTGSYPPNPSELLMRAELPALVARCAEHFDLTIFDTPPSLAVTDPVILARNTGATLLVARHDMTLPGEVDAVIKTFAAAGLRLSGAILNGFDPRKAKGGYGYGYGYRYAYRQSRD